MKRIKKWYRWLAGEDRVLDCVAVLLIANRKAIVDAFRCLRAGDVPTFEALQKSVWRREHRLDRLFRLLDPKNKRKKKS